MPLRSPGLIFKTPEMKKGYSIYNYFASRENSRGVPLSYAIRTYMPIPEDSENRYVQIIYQASLFGNNFTKDSRKVLDILKELILITDAET